MTPTTVDNSPIFGSTFGGFILISLVLFSLNLRWRYLNIMKLFETGKQKIQEKPASNDNTLAAFRNIEEELLIHAKIILVANTFYFFGRQNRLLLAIQKELSLLTCFFQQFITKFFNAFQIYQQFISDNELLYVQRKAGIGKYPISLLETFNTFTFDVSAHLQFIEDIPKNYKKPF
jgi:hypothetical protein